MDKDFKRLIKAHPQWFANKHIFSITAKVKYKTLVELEAINTLTGAKISEIVRSILEQYLPKWKADNLPKEVQGELTKYIEVLRGK